ncbi:unnamed protein product, partial [Musa textilis]
KSKFLKFQGQNYLLPENPNPSTALLHYGRRHPASGGHYQRVRRPCPWRALLLAGERHYLASN